MLHEAYMSEIKVYNHPSIGLLNLSRIYNFVPSPIPHSSRVLLIWSTLTENLLGSAFARNMSVGGTPSSD